MDHTPRRGWRSHQVAVRLLVLLCLTGGALVEAQMPLPLQGQGQPSPGLTAITMDTLVDTYRSLNSNVNTYNAVFWLHLSWADARAQEAIQKATQQWVNSNQTTIGATSSCSLACDSSRQTTAGCCDDVWLPHVEIPNLVSIDQQSVYKYRVWIDRANSSIVHWVVKVTGEFNSPFDFRAWPFEHQHLLLEAQVASSLAQHAYLVMGQVAFLKNTPHTKGDTMPGWKAAKTTRRLYDSSECYKAKNSTSTIWSATTDIAQVALTPLDPTSWSQLGRGNATASVSVTSVASADCAADATGDFEALAQYSPRLLVVDIMVRRTTNYYVLAHIVPLLLLDYMVFITYAMERSDLESRMGVVVTLVLAVSALQFTYDFPPASYLNAVQQITLTSYVLYFIVACEAMLASHISRLHSRKRYLAALSAMAHDDRTNSIPFNRVSSNGSTGQGQNSAFQRFNTGFGIRSRRYSSGDPTLPDPPSALFTLPTAGKVRNRSSLQLTEFDVSGRDYASRLSNADQNPSVTVTQGRPAGPVAEGNETQPSDVERPSRIRRPSWCFNRRRRDSVQEKSGVSEKEDGFDCSEMDVSKRERRSSLRRSIDRGLNLSKAVSSKMNQVTKASRNLQSRIDKEEAFAQLFAARLDFWFSWFLLIGFTTCVAVLIYVNMQVGDHKLMLQADKPANM